jgi:hypothetical protein
MMDSMGLADVVELERIVRAHPQIVALVSGHIHRAMSACWAGTQAIVCPSTAHTLDLDMDPDADIHYRIEPPAYCLHRWDGLLLTTYTVQAGDFPGPFSYT